MLSQNLDALAAEIGGYEATGVSMAPEAVRQIAGALRMMAEDARALERQVVPAAARRGLQDLEERGVAPIELWRARRANARRCGTPRGGAA